MKSEARNKENPMRGEREPSPEPREKPARSLLPEPEAPPFSIKFEVARQALLRERKLPWSESARRLFMEMSKLDRTFTAETLRKRFEGEKFSEDEQRWFSELAALNAFERAAEAEQNARLDGLTGLNRKHVLEAGLHREFEKRKDPAYRAGALSVFYADIDQFKRFNDKYKKHEIGDAVLSAVGQLIREVIEQAGGKEVAKGAYAARRYDQGEEFVGVFPGTKMEQMQQVAETIRKEIAKLKVFTPAEGKKKKQELIPETITVSIGIADVGEEDTVEQFLEKSERAAIYAKEVRGRNKVIPYTEEVKRWSLEKAAGNKGEPTGVEDLGAETLREEEALPEFRGKENLPKSIRQAVADIRAKVFDPDFPTPDQFLTSLKRALVKEQTEAFLFYSQMVEARARHLEQLSSKDALTGVENRKTLLSRLAGEVATARRERRLAREGRSHEVSVLLVDLDKFKEVNDGYGHRTGDRVLKQAGDLFRNFAMREENFIASTGRSGGEEFVLVLSGTPKADAEKVAERLRRAFEEAKFILPGVEKPHTQTLSIGVVSTSDFEKKESLSVAALLAKADAAMYRSKVGESETDNRNRVTPYGPVVKKWYKDEQKKLRKKEVQFVR